MRRRLAPLPYPERHYKHIGFLQPISMLHGLVCRFYFFNLIYGKCLGSSSDNPLHKECNPCKRLKAEPKACNRKPDALQTSPCQHKILWPISSHRSFRPRDRMPRRGASRSRRPTYRRSACSSIRCGPDRSASTSFRTR